jgi:hypothetical protein
MSWETNGLYSSGRVLLVPATRMAIALQLPLSRLHKLSGRINSVVETLDSGDGKTHLSLSLSLSR